MGFELTKIVETNGVEIPAGTTYSVTYTVDGEDPVTVDLLSGDPLIIDDLNPGSVVTFVEGALPVIDNALWATPSFSVDGETIGETATITVEESTLASVELTNTASAIPLEPAGFSVTKVVETTGVQVPSTTTYPVTYTIDDAAPVTIDIEAGESFVVDDIAVGAQVSITESASPVIAGVTWAQPALSIEGAASGTSASFMVQLDTVTEVTLTNSASATPVIAGPGGTPSSGNSLAATGATIDPSLLGAAALLVLAGFVLAARRRRV